MQLTINVITFYYQEDLKLQAIKTNLKIIYILLLIIITALTYWFLSPTPTPIEDTKLPEMTVEGKKARFKELLVPAINKVFDDLTKQYQEVSEQIASGDDNDKLAQLRTEYKAADNQALLAALKPHPRSIALAQAAMESSWATSRFFLQANNVFGVWSFDENEPRIAAGEQRGDKTIWVKKYDSIEDSVRDYYRVLSRGDAFQEFRNLAMTSNDPFELVKKLDKYSEKGELYGEELTSIINFNKFTEYD